MERDGVSPTYLRAVRTATLNALHRTVSSDSAAEPWVRDALGSNAVAAEAVAAVVVARFGEQRVIFDPSDREANHIATARGMSVIPPAALSREEWANVRRFRAALPAGQVTPSPKPFTPGGVPLELVPLGEQTTAMRAKIHLAERLGNLLLGFRPLVQITNTPSWPFRATWSEVEHQLLLNESAIAEFSEARFLELLIHEFAHHFEGNHLAEGFHRALLPVGGGARAGGGGEPEPARTAGRSVRRGRVAGATATLSPATTTLRRIAR